MGGEGIDLSFRFDPVDRDTWRERVEADLGEAGIDSLAQPLAGGLVVRPLYSEEDLPGHELGWPGAPPFVRGALAQNRWRVVHEASGDDAGAIVDGARRALEGGADAVLLGRSAFDRIDAEALASLDVPIIADPGADAIAWLRALAGMKDAALRFDPLGTLAREGALPYGAETAWRVLAELATADRRVSVDSRPYHEGGASPSTELAVALATGLEYLRALSAAGHPLADAPRRMSFSFACDADVFVGIAKLRAARLTWSKVLRALGIDGPDEGMHIHAFGSRRTRSELEPMIDVLRGTASAFAAVVGGAQDVTLEGYEDSPRAERLARNAQLLLRWESHLDRVVDPGGGSYAVEALTDALAREAWASFQDIEREGGMLSSLTSGSIQERLATGASALRVGLAKREVGRVGVNRYPGPADPPEPAPRRVAPRATSDQRAVKAVRGAFDDAPRGALADAILASDASVEVLRNELLRGADPMSAPPIELVRDAAPYEALRRRCAALPEPERAALVIGLGSVRKVKPQMDFCGEALAVAGLRPRIDDVRAEIGEVDLTDVPRTVVCVRRDAGAGSRRSRAAAGGGGDADAGGRASDRRSAPGRRRPSSPRHGRARRSPNTRRREC